MDFSKLSKVKKQIIRSVYRFGACLDMTYVREKESLQRAGWLQGRRIGDSIISGQYMLTDAGRAAYEQYRDDTDLVGAALGLKASAWAQAEVHLVEPQFNAAINGKRVDDEDDEPRGFDCPCPECW